MKLSSHLTPSLVFQQQHKERFLEELCTLLSIPSVSAQQEYADDCKRCAETLADFFTKAGARARVLPTNGHPLVYAEKIISADLPTVLVYGHYDVQPVDPIELWNTPPFEPTIRDKKIYARGSADDKGQMFMYVKALESLVATNTLPVNVKYIIEGEEEIGSEQLEKFIEQEEGKSLLKADVLVLSDTAMFSVDQPTIDTGLRGIASIELTLTGPNRDLHSGVYGGAVDNPALALARILAQLHDENNYITVPGFYDKVVELTPQERAELGQFPFDLQAWKQELGLREDWGEKGYSCQERSSIRPTLDVNGLWSGYTGEGSKTVLPSQAHAKITCRLVPDQDYREIIPLLEKYIRQLCPPTMQLEVTHGHGAFAYVMPSTHPSYIAAEKAFTAVYGKKPLPKRGGGSIPIVVNFEKQLGLKSVLLGFGLDDDNLHSPNEKFNLDNYYKGIATITHFMHYIGSDK